MSPYLTSDNSVLAISKDIGIAYTGTYGRITNGMQREWDAMADNNIPLIAFNECNDYAVERIARAVASLEAEQ